MGMHNTADIGECIIQRLAVVTKCYRTVVGVSLLYEYLTLEPTHFGVRKYADTIEADPRTAEQIFADCQ